MATMMTTRLVVRTGVACFGRRAVSNAFVARATPRRVVAIPGGARVAFAVRAVATDADAPTTTVGKVFKRHERIAAIKVRVVNHSGRGGSRPRRSHSQRGRDL
jgi:HD-like signal output (HDOD) protein